jgi:hypothetical protein
MLLLFSICSDLRTTFPYLHKLFKTIILSYLFNLAPHWFWNVVGILSSARNYLPTWHNELEAARTINRKLGSSIGTANQQLIGPRIPHSRIARNGIVTLELVLDSYRSTYCKGTTKSARSLLRRGLPKLNYPTLHYIYLKTLRQCLGSAEL